MEKTILDGIIEKAEEEHKKWNYLLQWAGEIQENVNDITMINLIIDILKAKKIDIERESRPEKKLTETTKYCNYCKKTKPVEQFSKNRKAKDGLQTYCKICHKIVNDRCKEKTRKKKALKQSREQMQSPKQSPKYEELSIHEPTYQLKISPHEINSVLYALDQNKTGIIPTTDNIMKITKMKKHGVLSVLKHLISTAKVKRTFSEYGTVIYKRC
jgi:hypothetical protein